MSIQILLGSEFKNDKAQNLYCNTLTTNELDTNNLITHNVLCDTATINSDLVVKATDGSLISFTTADKGNSGDVLAIDSLGHTYWTSNPLPPASGIIYNGPLPAIIGSHLKVSNNIGNTATESRMVELSNLLDMGGLAISNAISLQSTDVNTTNTKADNILANANVLNINTTGPSGLVNFNTDSIDVKLAEVITSKTIFAKNQELITKKYVDDAINNIPSSALTFQDVYDNSIPATINLTSGNFNIVNGLNTILSVSATDVQTSLLKTDFINSNNNDNINISSINGLVSNKYKLNGGLSSQYLMADGSTTQSSQIGSNIYLYQFDTTLTPAPPSGHIEFNTTTITSVSNVYISHITSDGIDIDPYFLTIQAGNILYIQNRDDSTVWVKFNIVSISIISNSYINISVSYNSALGSPIFLNNHNIYFSIFNNTTLADARISVLETKTQNQLAIFGNTDFTGIVKSDTLKLTSNTTNILLGDGNTISQYSLSSAGSGTSLVSTGTGPIFLTKGIVNGSGIGLSVSTTDITLSNSSPASGITLTNSGTGSSLLNSTTNPSFTTKGIIAGSGIGLSATANDITIASNGLNTIGGMPLIGFDSGGQILLSASISYFYQFFVQSSFITSKILLYKISANTTTTTVSIGIYASTGLNGGIGSLISSANNITLTQGYTTMTLSSTASLLANTTYYIGVFSTSSGGTNLLCKNIGTTNNPTTLLIQSGIWTSGIAPTTITTQTSVASSTMPCCSLII